ncbi:uncharacterized protein C3orf85 homolog [Pterocles gutturalis]
MALECKAAACMHNLLAYGESQCIHYGSLETQQLVESKVYNQRHIGQIRTKHCTLPSACTNSLQFATSLKMFQILVSALLFTASISGVLGAPFLTEESANQFIRLKRQIPYSQYWDPSSSQNGWGYTVAEQVSESWTALRDTAQYYVDLGSFAFDPSVASDNMRSYMDMLQQTGTHLQQQTRMSY